MSHTDVNKGGKVVVRAIQTEPDAAPFTEDAQG